MAGTYEVLRGRMSGAAEELARRAQALNTRRVAVFGGSELELTGSAHLRTGQDRVPRDIAQVGGLLLFGYNTPSAGLRRGTGIGDVFALYRPHDGQFEDAEPGALPGLLDDPRFERDFEELHRYYREASLLQLHRVGALLLAVFRTGERLTDIRVLRWRLAPDGTPEYLDAKGERDHLFPPAHDVEWRATGREDQVLGRHPHLSVEGALFVTTVGGALTVKAENDTETAAGLYSEPVDEPLQALADAEVEYARAGGLILLRVLPYNETRRRHLVYNERTREVVRLDGIGQACRLLPEDQGLIFPGGYYLASAPAGAAAKTFETNTEGLEYQGTVRSPNGEDLLYVFHARAEGRSLLLPYNLIRETVPAPIPSHGWSLFEDGTLAVLRAAGEEPARVHPVQLWRTPCTSDSYAADLPTGTGPLARVGNAELVRGISDCLSVARMAEEKAPGAAVFTAVAAACTRAADLHHWLSADGLEGLDEPLATLRTTAGRAVEEFARVERLREESAAALESASREVTALVRRARGEAPGNAEGWVTLLTGLRRAQGRVASLHERRHIDRERVTALGEELTEALEATGRRAVDRLARPDAFDGARALIAELAARAAEVTTAAEAGPLGERIDEQADGLRVVTDVVGGLESADATVRTGLLERIGEVTGAVNRARAVLEGRRRELLESEGRAEFSAEFALLGQAVTGALAASGTPEECDEQLARLLLRLENLESRFGVFEDFLERMTERREEISETFAARKQAQLDARARHAERLAKSAGRLLETVTRRSQALPTPDEINAFFAADPLVARVRTAAEELRTLGDTVRADELDGRLQAARQEAARTLRDRGDLYDAGGTVRLGRHRFTVNTRPATLTLVPGDGAPVFAITGTDYRAPVPDGALTGGSVFWDQPLVSESPGVYRAEHLAASVLARALSGADDPGLEAAADTESAALLGIVRRAAEAAHDEGYDRGVHDHDAARILSTVLRLRRSADLLRFTPEVRAAAQLFWAHGTGPAERAGWATRARSLDRARAAFGRTAAIGELAAELTTAAADFLTGQALPARTTEAVGGYLVEELAGAPTESTGPAFVTGTGARELLTGFREALGGADSPAAKEFAEDLTALGGDLPARHQLVAAWLGSYAETCDGGASGQLAAELPEAVAIELCGDLLARREVAAPLTGTATGLLGTHPRLRGGELTLRLDEFLARTEEFRTVRMPAHRAHTRQRNALLAAERDRLRLETHQPRVMPAFVRNRLIDEVYLPLIGDNLAKQLGSAGEQRRTDSQGLLMLLSPPGYGKTTLVEYAAARLGLVFVRIDGPALGHRTTSLDPAAAPDAAARREVEKINFALEMGNNVFLHLDDIQHTSPELLQKFIPLCDAQRRIDGAEGTYDLRGKRFAVCMAGNPFTESGARFRVPDMLANRADVWNLGDVLSGREELFALSHIENALTSHPELSPLAARERSDVDLLVRLARGDTSARSDQLAHPYTPGDLDRILPVLGALLRVRDTVLRVNAAYIASATQDEAARTEPPFRLQGSYRNTGRLAERIAGVMNDAELEALIDDHYLAEAQTLTSGAEANLLKLAELRGRLTPEQAARWAEVKRSFRPRTPGSPSAEPWPAE